MRLSVEASVGVVVAPAGDVDLTELLRRADIAMYQAKRAADSVAGTTRPGTRPAPTGSPCWPSCVRRWTPTTSSMLALQPAVDLRTGATPPASRR